MSVKITALSDRLLHQIRTGRTGSNVIAHKKGPFPTLTKTFGERTYFRTFLRPSLLLYCLLDDLAAWRAMWRKVDYHLATVGNPLQPDKSILVAGATRTTRATRATRATWSVTSRVAGVGDLSEKEKYPLRFFREGVFAIFCNKKVFFTIGSKQTIFIWMMIKIK